MKPSFSTAGFYRLENTGRTVYSMNPGWRFYKGSLAEGASEPEFDDSSWEVVSLPNGMEILPLEASGCVNYQGEAWYRKHFAMPDSLKGKKLFLYFEGIMGKSKVWVNGTLVKEHFGGFLPVIADITPHIVYGQENVIAVLADNSDDPSFPPGKPQDMLDYSYFGGIYRDCWLIAHNNVYITDPNYVDKIADGGLFISYDRVSDEVADVRLQLNVKNELKSSFSGKVFFELTDADGKCILSAGSRLSVSPDSDATVTETVTLKHPQLWSPERPYLYNLNIYVKDKKGNVTDGYRRRIGIRSIEFKGEDGFWLNGKPYECKLMGGNRHQDFAMIGFALSNSLHYRDAKKLRDAGMKVIRNAHYPQDPAFMDACDELGLFVIVNTPGWQFWNNAPEFGKRVYSDIRNMVRRDRNHPSVWLWEPILNETSYPEDFACNAQNCVMEEYPFPYCYTACDYHAKGNKYYKVKFGRPYEKDREPGITYFVREWGDNVDDWSSHNSTSRANRAWGEVPMLVQADGYIMPTYQSTCYSNMSKDSRQIVGGALWHSFDHQRGYHPDPFYGGIMDAFRQPKYSYYAFMAQRSPEKSDIIAENGPMVFIANAMTPFSPTDITVYTNCDEVRLTCGITKKVYTKKRDVNEKASSPMIFKNVFHFMQDKSLARAQKHDESYLLAEGLIDGKVVAEHKVYPARRPVGIRLTADTEGMPIEANGSDYVTIIAEVIDERGTVKRLNNSNIRFEISGEGELVGDASVMANPRPLQWGTAPILLRSTEKPGKINIHASVIMPGSQMPVSGTLELETVPASTAMIYDKDEMSQEKAKTRHETIGNKGEIRSYEEEIQKLRRELNTYRLKEVEKQQSDFELAK